MQLKKRLLYSGVASAIALISSVFVPIVPCRTGPNIPNPIYKWTMCSLNPDNAKYSRSITEYFGYTTSLTDAFVATILITFIVVMAFFHFTTRKKRKS
jgi:VIT1/CCC1 family predicted Fe2+/Mn2+ transporter